MGMNMINTGTKRAREADFDSMTATTMANCLMLLSRAGEFEALNMINHQNNNPSRVFECKTCNKQFASFQALGGHRASHKKPKLGGDVNLDQSKSLTSPPKPKTHECSICGLEFAVGQALGGHMRRHRASMNEEHHRQSPVSSSVSSGAHDDLEVVKKKEMSNTNTGSRRAWFLDLNLTPFENDLEFQLGKVVPPSIG